jgi:hypothetical protein
MNRRLEHGRSLIGTAPLSRSLQECIASVEISPNRPGTAGRRGRPERAGAVRVCFWPRGVQNSGPRDRALEPPGDPNGRRNGHRTLPTRFRVSYKAHDLVRFLIR